MRILCRPGLSSLACAAAVGGLAVTACGPAASVTGQHASPARSAISTAPISSAAPSRSPAALTSLPVAPGQGRLAQTRAMPKASGAAFHAMVTDLWLAITMDKPSLAHQAFFPLAAYRQVKAIYDPADDLRTH